MPVYKDKKRGTWYIVTRYKDWTGKLRTTTKRGFKTKMDAKNYEIDFTEMKNNSLSMTFGSFVKIYMDSMQNRLKENTLLTKQTIIEKKFLPYFKDKKLCDITPKDVIYWQNEMMKQTSKKDKEFSPTYLKTVHNQLSAISIMPSAIMDLKIIQQELQDAWEKKQMEKCSFGQKKST